MDNFVATRDRLIFRLLSLECEILHRTLLTMGHMVVPVSWAIIMFRWGSRD